MKQRVLAALFAAALVVTPAFAQEHGAAEPAQAGAAHGGEGATTAQPATSGHEGAGTAHAEAATQHGEGHAEAEMPNETLWKWANFAILVAGLGYLIGKHAPAFFHSRTQQIQQGIAEATKTREEAEARAAAIERQVNNLQSEVAQLRAQSREEIAREGERIRQETEATLRKVQAQSEAEIASAAKHAAHDLKAYAAKLALELAEGQIRSKMSGAAQDELTGAFISGLRRKAAKN